MATTLTLTKLNRVSTHLDELAGLFDDLGLEAQHDFLYEAGNRVEAVRDLIADIIKPNYELVYAQCPAVSVTALAESAAA